jgi:hypothetical protein
VGNQHLPRLGIPDLDTQYITAHYFVDEYAHGNAFRMCELLRPYPTCEVTNCQYVTTPVL